jgi:hypothetical protein
MAEQARNKGQSLVEFSLVFPAVLLTMILVLEFFFIVYAKISLGFTADRIARSAAVPNGFFSPTAVTMNEYAKHFRTVSSWGTPRWPKIQRENLPPGPDYPFEVIDPLDMPPQLLTVDISFLVSPMIWFTNIIRVPTLGAHVELPVEPEVPQT